MNNTDFESRYEDFLSKNNKIIIQELKSQYSHYCSDFSSFWVAQDFGLRIALPLFAIFSVIAISFLRGSTIALVVLSPVFIVLVLMMHHWWNSLSEKICDRFFSMYEYEKVILKCTNWSKQKELRQANSKDEINAIEDFYDLCQRQVIKEFFSYR